MAYGGEARARLLLESGAYKEAAEMFVATGELASAARAFVCAKDFFRAAECYELASKPLDAARLYLMIRHWRKAAEIYGRLGDTLRAELAMEQLKKEQEAMLAPGPKLPGNPPAAHAPSPSAPASAPPRPAVSAPQAAPPAAPPPLPKLPDLPWPEGDVWKAIRAGDMDGAVQLYLKTGSGGWDLLEQAAAPAVKKALGEMLFHARDHTVAAEAFRKCGQDLRAAQCLSLAGLNEEAADLFVRCGQKTEAAKHLEIARAWDQAARLYVEESLFLDAARCEEKNDEPAKAAGLYLKAKKPDLALPLLQSVAPGHRSFGQCRLLAGKILLQKGQKDLAVSLLSPLVQGALKSDEDLETAYQVAALLEQGGAPDRARAAYLRLQEARFGYKEVSHRIEKLGEPQGPEAPPPAPAAPAQPAAATPTVDLGPLRDCSLFNHLSLEELRRLWMIGKVGECRPGQVLLKAGQVSEGLILVLSGGLTITRDPANPSVAEGFLGPGDYVGLGCLVKGPPQSNALVAQKGTRLLLLPLKALASLLQADPELGMRLYRSVAEALTHALMAEKSKAARG